jgi:hypothetical protein
LSGIFPMLDGDLELAPLGSERCRLTLSASYMPPFGDVGRALDRALLHRVAQSTVRSFLARVAMSLEVGDGDQTASVRRDQGGARSTNESFIMLGDVPRAQHVGSRSQSGVAEWKALSERTSVPAVLNFEASFTGQMSARGGEW